MTQALVVGCGSIGTVHIRNLLKLDVSVTACDISSDRLNAVSEEFDIETMSNYETGLKAEPDCVLVCTPPSTHIGIAMDAIGMGADVFIEKPLATTSSEASPLVKMDENIDSVVYVACNMRFHPPVKLIEEWLNDGKIGNIEFLRLRYGNALPNWRPGDYREYYSSSSEEGGGVLLDAIHELDIADHWIGGTETVQSAVAKVSTLDIDSEDTAEILLQGNDNLCEVHLDYLRPVRSRTYEVIGAEGMARWHAEGKNPELSRVTLHDANGNLVSAREFELTLNEMYIAETKDFLDCVKGTKHPPVNAARGARLVRIVECAKQASDRGEATRIE